MIIKIDLKDSTGIELNTDLGFELHAASTGIYVIYRYNVDSTFQIAWIPYEAISSFKLFEK